MKLSNVDRASQLIEDVLTDTGETSKVYLSVMVPPAHKALIEGLGKLNRGTKQAAIVRAIIEEWCELKKEKINGAAQ